VTWVQEPMITRREAGGESIFHLFPEGQLIAACCGLPLSEFTADDMSTDSEELFTCWSCCPGCEYADMEHV
jgi:hypothetical protein